MKSVVNKSETKITLKEVIDADDIASLRKWFQKNSKNVDDIISENAIFDRTALLHACDHGSMKCALFLIRVANIHYVTSEGYTALHYVCMKGRFPLVQALVEAGADIDKPIVNWCVSDTIGKTPFMLSCYLNHHKCALYLASHGCDLRLNRKRAWYDPEFLISHEMKENVKTFFKTSLMQLRAFPEEISHTVIAFAFHWENLQLLLNI